MSQDLAHNLPEYAVSEIAGAVRRTLEDAFGRIRVRGEISQPSFPRSGHCYLRLKDDSAVLDGVIWRGTLGRLGLRPEEGMEVIATGRVTSYPAGSRYQIVIESLELAGAGALLKLLEERKQRLAAEGLFAPERKRPLPFLPAVIGVVTSPTGAVIRDILHRLDDRFPRRVLVWPVAVQGEGAAGQVAAAIRGLNALDPAGPVPRPDVLIVARGGGSLEDLMAFNEEEVVRAAADSAIPLISAVGHETDTTLIDFAADRRAPTPTAAAEMAVPVRTDLLAQTADLGARQTGAMARMIAERRLTLQGLARGLGDPRRLLEAHAQRLDHLADRLARGLPAGLDRRRARVAELGWRLRHPRERLAEARGRLDRLGDRLNGGLRHQLGQGRTRLGPVAARLDGPARRLIPDAAQRLEQAARLLEGYAYKRTLERGFVLVTDAQGRPVTGAGGCRPGQALNLQFHDGKVDALVAGNPPRKPRAKPAPAGQPRLL